MRLKQPELRRARIEIIPMIDTIFFLLVFFMITWLSMVKMNGLTMSVPRENQAATLPAPSMFLSISPTGQYYVDGREAGEKDWADRLRADLIVHPNGIVVLNVATNQKTQTLINLMDQVNRQIIRTRAHAQVIVATPRVTENNHAAR